MSSFRVVPVTRELWDDADVVLESLLAEEFKGVDVGVVVITPRELDAAGTLALRDAIARAVQLELRKP